MWQCHGNISSLEGLGGGAEGMIALIKEKVAELSSCSASDGNRRDCEEVPSLGGQLVSLAAPFVASLLVLMSGWTHEQWHLVSRMSLSQGSCCSFSASCHPDFCLWEAFCKVLLWIQR